MDYDAEFSDHAPPSFGAFSESMNGSSNFKKQGKGTEVKGFNPGLIVLLVVGGLLITFLVGNYLLYMYAQKTLPPRKKKPISKKKLKKEKLKQGVSAPGEPATTHLLLPRRKHNQYWLGIEPRVRKPAPDFTTFLAKRTFVAEDMSCQVTS
ncbi:hypothetical protein RJ639_045989 [Escallonia herrerae]|uniref:Uncharacterized protein n=1 Tax=Escallonia herrerae TaxID=1293975 RepID=A0AA88W593_9ASTE|nr:hypothetical protein RJ639_045989 [Escallonia herrerae]